MYIKVSGINKMINRYDLNKVFTFTRPIYKTIEHSPDVRFYFYSTLHEIAMAEKLNKRSLIECLEVSFIKNPLKEKSCLSISSSRSSCCLYTVCDRDVSIDMIERLFGLPARCYFRWGEFKEIYIIEFKEAVEIKKADFTKYVFAFEDYIDYVIENGLFDQE
ncbi:uncharacterized protein Eint_031380 [Encephalitozoon intestinalis ATCC 50506]|uniref:Uncharacterized protein n=1 Tax=Encephalitozoon intestinalis (strain ATCC 50506) TaxID=876142 RepID=E0S6E5_ENCIT|nr:uncharacterized protein Eint_031380 [Encephalitozoon intestinalis ATCC 50506]ADM11280.1 hypothetical protein Eint_031380 [Encephalitozoon intestinalis ATCC 50506]UTX44948.1 hypothetical protein GPK93_03g04770 [Encephalitozoon intestinalis]